MAQIRPSKIYVCTCIVCSGLDETIKDMNKDTSLVCTSLEKNFQTTLLMIYEKYSG